LVRLKLIKIEDKVQVAAQIIAETHAGYEALPTNLHRGYSRENTSCVLLCKQHLLSAAVAAASHNPTQVQQHQQHQPQLVHRKPTQRSKVKPKCQVLSAVVKVPGVHLTLLDDALASTQGGASDLVHSSWTPLVQIHVTDIAVQATKRQEEWPDTPPNISTDLNLEARVACQYFDRTTAEWEAFLTRWAFKAKFVEGTHSKLRRASIESSDALAVYCNARVCQNTLLNYLFDLSSFLRR
jgi:hypothetical protein